MSTKYEIKDRDGTVLKIVDGADLAGTILEGVKFS